MPLTNEQIEKVAKLAHLSLEADEIERFREQLSGILGYVEKLQTLDVREVPPTINGIEAEGTRLRADEVRPSLPTEQALANAPQQAEHLFLVPRIIE